MLFATVAIVRSLALSAYLHGKSRGAFSCVDHQLVQMFHVTLGLHDRMDPSNFEDCGLVLESDMGQVQGFLQMASLLFPLGMILACAGYTACCLGVCLVYFWAPLIRAGDSSKQLVDLALQSCELCLHC